MCVREELRRNYRSALPICDHDMPNSRHSHPRPVLAIGVVANAPPHGPKIMNAGLIADMEFQKTPINWFDCLVQTFVTASIPFCLSFFVSKCRDS